MGKLKLNLDELQVESFYTAGDELLDGGTVLGQSGATQPGDYTCDGQTCTGCTLTGGGEYCATTADGHQCIECSQNCGSYDLLCSYSPTCENMACVSANLC